MALRLDNGATHDDAAKRRLRNWLARPGSQLATALLILAWTGLTVTEIAVGPLSARTWLGWLSLAIGVVFAIELLVRYVAATSRARFLREHWADLLAVASIVPPLAAAYPATRLLRLLRVLTLGRIVRRLPSLPGFARRKTARRALGLAGFVALAAITASAALLAFEGGDNPQIASFGQAFWFSLYSIFATQPTPEPPVTLGGRIVSLVLIFVG
ncbi:MAG TPA: ion transporter, partial [Polyangiaceae bacterium]|nr:ion transporter [Polyangiaceae bacterium]